MQHPAVFLSASWKRGITLEAPAVARTKLIHGGLRYLKQLEIQLVKEVGRERALLYERAPHLVLPRPMMLPIYKGGTYGKLTSSIGLWLYDRLAGVKERSGAGCSPGRRPWSGSRC